MGTVHRASEEWKKVYRMRPIEERYFSSGKQSRLLDKHQTLGQRRVILHARMSTLSHLLTSWGRLMASDYANMRRMHIRLPRNPAPGCVECRLCPHHGQKESAE